MATDALVVAVAVEVLLVACTSTLVLVTAVLPVALMVMLHVPPGAIGPAHPISGVVTPALLNAVGRG